MANLGLTELLIVAGVLILLFGATKLPKLARSMGESARIFKSETKSLHHDDTSVSHEAKDSKFTHSATRARAGQGGWGW